MIHNTGGWIRTNILQFWRLSFYQLNYTHRTELGGLEPPNAGVKVPCLTAWRQPYEIGYVRFEPILYESKSYVLPFTPYRYLLLVRFELTRFPTCF